MTTCTPQPLFSYEKKKTMIKSVSHFQCSGLIFSPILTNKHLYQTHLENHFLWAASPSVMEANPASFHFEQPLSCERGESIFGLKNCIAKLMMIYLCKRNNGYYLIFLSFLVSFGTYISLIRYLNSGLLVISLSPFIIFCP